jgi:flagellar hook assembly protein FlgD
LYHQRVWDGDNNGSALIDMGCYEYGAPQYVDVEEHEITNSSVHNPNLSNYPNPFNPETTISFDLAEPGKVKLAIYNIKGQKVKTLMDCTTAPGTYECNWNGKDESGKPVSSGQYIVKLKQDKKETATKIMLLK